MAIASASGLRNGIKPGSRAYHRAKIHVHAGFDQLCTYAQHGVPGRQTGNDGLVRDTNLAAKHRLAVGRAHVGTQVKDTASIDLGLAPQEYLSGGVLGIGNDQATAGTIQFSNGEGGDVVVGPTARFSGVSYIHPPQCVKQVLDVGHDFVPGLEADRTLLDGDALQQGLGGRTQHNRAAALFHQKIDGVVEQMNTANG